MPGKIKKWAVAGISIGLLIFCLILIFFKMGFFKNWYYHEVYEKEAVQNTLNNYKYKVMQAAVFYDIPPEYLLALITLECSGRANISPRFEKHVFKKLEKVKNGKLESYDNVFLKDLEGIDEGGLKNLASSWGPFQLMGYKCLELDLKVKELRGENAVLNGTKWIKSNYGKYLEKEKFKDAFHIHNTGTKYPVVGPPRTFHSSYVPRGMKYMASFKQILQGKNPNEAIDQRTK